MFGDRNVGVCASDMQAGVPVRQIEVLSCRPVILPFDTKISEPAKQLLLHYSTSMT